MWNIQLLRSTGSQRLGLWLFCDNGQRSTSNVSPTITCLYIFSCRLGWCGGQSGGLQGSSFACLATFHLLRLLSIIIVRQPICLRRTLRPLTDMWFSDAFAHLPDPSDYVRPCLFLIVRGWQWYGVCRINVSHCIMLSRVSSIYFAVSQLTTYFHSRAECLCYMRLRG